jgi:hypothetical protein
MNMQALAVFRQHHRLYLAESVLQESKVIQDTLTLPPGNTNTSVKQR